MAVQLAGCIILDEKGRLLLIHRNTERLVQWELPGGKVEEGEDLKIAAIREVREEVGIEVRITREVGRTNFEDNGVNWEYHWFLATIIEGVPRIGEPDRYDGLNYFDLKTIDTKGVSINIVNLIDALENSSVRL